MHIELEGMPNTRDLGGMISKDGRKIKKHMLLRSGQLYAATQSDIDTLVNEYNLGLIVDFRSLSEKEEKPDPSIKGVNYIYNPIMKQITKGITRDKKSDNDTVKMIILDMANDLKRAEQYMVKMYEDLINNDYALSQYGKFLDLLLTNNDKAILWHCTAGKDRAGLATVLVLECLGIAREDIINDYLLTNKYVQNDINKMVNSIKAEFDFPIIEDVVKALFGIKREYMEDVYATIEKEYGSVENFLDKKLGIDNKKIQIMREHYLE